MAPDDQAKSPDLGPGPPRFTGSPVPPRPPAGRTGPTLPKPPPAGEPTSQPAGQADSTPSKPPVEPHGQASDTSMITGRSGLAGERNPAPRPERTAGKPMASGARAKDAPKPADIIIRTMRDDMAAAKATPSAAKAQPPAKAGRPTPRKRAAKSMLPLPAKQPVAKEKNVIRPTKRKKTKSVIRRFVFVTFVLLLALAGGGAWWLFYGQDRGAGPAITPEAELTSADVIPQDTQLIVQYQLSTPSDKSSLQELWNNNRQQPATLSDLLSGDPRLLLADEDLQEFYYVLLPNEPRLYTVIPRTSYTSQLLTDQNFIQVLPKGNWYIVHSLNTETYTTALTSGTLAQTGGLPLEPNSSPMRWIISSSLISQLYDTIDAEDLTLVPPKSRMLAATFDPPANIITFTSDSRPPATTSPATDSQQALYQVVPGDADFILLGSSFAADLSQWANLTPSPDASILDQPAVQQLISELTEPYAYYRRLGPDGASDIGLVITLPPALQSVLRLGDPTVEQALAALVPLITNRTISQELAFAAGAFADTPLRYVNLVDSTQALDYAITDQYLFIASSKEGMFTVLDTLADTPTIDTPTSQVTLLISRTAVPVGQTIVASTIQHPLLAKLLPVTDEQSPIIPIVIVIDDSSLAGSLLLGTAAQPTPQIEETR